MTNSATATGLTVPAAQTKIESLLSREETPENDHDETPPAAQQTPASEAPPEDDEAAPPSPEDEPAESEHDAAEEAPPDDEAPAQDEQPEPRYRVKAHGKEEDVPLSELLKGYSRTADYTRKTQELAEQRKQAEAEFEAVRGERAKYGELLTKLEQALTEGFDTEPDWTVIRATKGEAEYAAQWADYQYRKQAVEQVRAEKQELARQQAADRAKAHTTMLEQEHQALIARRPEWSDSKKYEADARKIAEWATTKAGFTPADLAGVIDHRVVLVLEKAMRADELEAVKAAKPAPTVQQKIANAKKTAAPGPAGSVASKPASELTRAKQRLAKTGSTQDAAAVIERLL